MSTFFAILFFGYTTVGASGAVYAILTSSPQMDIAVRNALEVTLLSFLYFLRIARSFPSFDGNPGTEWLDRIPW